MPHFQTNPTSYILFLDMLLVLLLFISLNHIQKLMNKFVKITCLLLVFGGFFISYLVSITLDSKYYDLWSHLGSGTMKLRSEIVTFGDLAHLTSAAKCNIPITVGENICDPWGRAFNQNPQVVKFFRFFGFTNLQMIGLISTFTFMIIIFLGIKLLKLRTLGIYLFLAMPPVILAVDRGNEILTISLIIVGYYFLEKEAQLLQFMGAIFLLLAACFKLWPVFIVVALLFTSWFRLKFSAKLVLGGALLYWIINSSHVFQMLQATQRGSSFGASFGLSLLFRNGIDSIRFILLFVFTLGMFIFLVRAGRSRLESFISSTRGMQALRRIAPFMFAYSAIWVSGDSFMYRMVVFIPIILILSSFYYMDFALSNFLIVAILVTALTSRLPIAIAVSGALAIYFTYILFFIFWRFVTSPDADSALVKKSI